MGSNTRINSVGYLREPKRKINHVNHCCLCGSNISLRGKPNKTGFCSGCLIDINQKHYTKIRKKLSKVQLLGVEKVKEGLRKLEKFRP